VSDSVRVFSLINHQSPSDPVAWPPFAPEALTGEQGSS